MQKLWRKAARGSRQLMLISTDTLHDLSQKPGAFGLGPHPVGLDIQVPYGRTKHEKLRLLLFWGGQGELEGISFEKVALTS